MAVVEPSESGGGGSLGKRGGGQAEYLMACSCPLINKLDLPTHGAYTGRSTPILHRVTVVCRPYRPLDNGTQSVWEVMT